MSFSLLRKAKHQVHGAIWWLRPAECDCVIQPDTPPHRVIAFPFSRLIAVLAYCDFLVSSVINKNFAWHRTPHSFSINRERPSMKSHRTRMQLSWQVVLVALHVLFQITCIALMYLIVIKH